MLKTNLQCDMTSKSITYLPLQPETSFSIRLKFALNQARTTQAKLARQIGVKQQVIQYLCSDRAKGSRFTPKIATALNVNPQWLADGDSSMLFQEDLKSDTYTHNKIPILQPDQVKSLIRKQTKIQFNQLVALSSPSVYLPNLEITQWIWTNTKFGANSYALKIKDQAMSLRFEENTFIIIDPDRQPKDGDFVVAYINQTNELVFRQLIKKKNDEILRPLNTCGYNEIKMTSLDVIYGVLGEARWIYA